MTIIKAIDASNLDELIRFADNAAEVFGQKALGAYDTHVRSKGFVSDVNMETSSVEPISNSLDGEIFEGIVNLDYLNYV